MPNLPVRGLSTGGVNLDVPAVSLPLTSWSYARNVSFVDGQARRSPVFKTVEDGIGSAVRFIAPFKPSNDSQQVLCASDDGSLALYASGKLTPVSGILRTFPPAPGGWTACQTGDVLYVNNPSNVPRALLPTTSNFIDLANWDSTWRAGVLRTFAGVLIAMNISKGGNNLPTTVKASGPVYFGAVPASWDASDVTTNAYENNLADMDGGIIDGLTLGQSFLIYTPKQVWEMQTDTTFSYTFRKILDNAGAIATNCVVSVGGLHYVFGSNDLYATDGSSFKSLADGVCRKHLFRTLDRTNLDRCFTAFNPVNNEIIFAYVSKDPRCNWSSPTGCNAAIVYNIGTNTMAPLDLPNVVAMCNVNVSQIATWGSATEAWSADTVTWADSAPPNVEHVVAASPPGASPAVLGTGRLLAYDFADQGILGLPMGSDVAVPAILERVSMGLDTPDAGTAPLRMAKTISSIFPLTTLSQPLTLGVTLGTQMAQGEAVVWEPEETFDPTQDDRLDLNLCGKYLAVRFTLPATCDAEVSGFDLDIKANGTR